MTTQLVAKKSQKRRVLHRENLGSRLHKDFHKNWILYLMALPAIAYFLVYCYAPMAGLYIAFTDYKITDGIFSGDWVGFKWFIRFFQGPYFGRLLRNTLLLSLETLLWAFPIPIIFALVLNEIRSVRFKKLAQTVTYLPHFVSIIVICGLVVDFTSLDGLINTVIQMFGGEPIAFLAKPEWFRTVYVSSEIWHTFGWNSIVFLAALTSIDIQQFEAARLDGASRLQQMVYISLPSIIPTIVTVTEQILDFLQLEYANSELTLSYVADRFYITSSYLSAFFKENVTRLRIDHAKKLICTTNLPMGVIAVQVGYASGNTFTRIFKKAEGITPSQYRESSLK